MELTYRIVGHLILFCYFLRSSQAITPVFTAYTPSPIKEGLPPGSFYYQFVASHAVSYSFEAKASEWFNINSSGYATVNKTIDREDSLNFLVMDDPFLSYKDLKILMMGNPFRYKVLASDGSSTGEADVIQQITDINDNPPIFTNLPRTINISEDLAVDALVYHLTADDKDEVPANYILFNIESGNEEGRFKISDGYNGKITLEKPLDFDKGTKRFELRIIAENADATPKLNASSILTINVLNVDDLGAKFEKGLYEATIVKDSLVGTVVTTVQAKDGDGLNATVEYKIYQETNVGAMYKINNNTGEITVNGPLSLGITVLVVTATSTVHSPVFTVVKVTVASMINMSFTVSVPEGQSNVVIFNLEPAEQFYNITGGTFSIIPGGQSGLFNIDGKNLKVGPQPLDRETKDQYQLSIALEKGGSTKGLVLVTIEVLDINDNKPSFQGEMPYTASVREDADVGHSIIRVTAEDPDKGMNGTVKYAITGGNPSDLFSIDNATGVISLAGSLDRETTAQYTLTVQAYDGGTPPMSNTTTVSINVTDVNDNSPVVNQTSITKILPEWATNGTQVAVVVATDLDSGENGRITYVIEEGADGKFVIDPVSGVLTTTGGLSYNAKPRYTIVVNARDHGSSPRSTTAVVSVLIEPKTNKSYTVVVTEGRTNEVVMNLLLVEQDYNTTGGNFSFSAGNDDSHFVIDPVTKELKIGLQPLDRENKDEYQLRITLEKDDKVRGVAMINIKVQDINDNPPIFEGSLPYKVMVREDIGTGESIFRVTATDIDGGDNGTVKYAVTAGNEQGSFSIDNITGVISISKMLDRETTAQYTLTVQAYDGGTPPMSNVTTVLINVTDVNDNSPVFNSTIINAAVLENAVNGALVMQVTANDKDIGENSKITYHILEGSYGKFIINQTSGVITTAGDLSFKEMSKYTVIVSARDNGLSPRTASALVYITIMSAGVNQYAPVFTKPVYLGGVYKDTSDEKAVLTVKATDADSGTNGEVTYELTENPAKTFFHLESVSGQLRTANSFFEKEGKLYILKAQAKDKGSNPKVSNTAELCVFVLRQSYSMELSAGVNQDFILKNFEEFRGVLDALTGGKAFIKSVRPQKDDSRASTIIFNTVKNKTELTTAEVKSLLDSKKDYITNNYSKWKLGAYGSPQVGSLEASVGGLSAVVGAMICLALLIGVGGIIMIIILIKKRREREIARKDTRVRFSDKLSYINIDGSLPVSKLKHVDSAQEAHEGTSNVSDETSSVGSEEVQTAPDVMNYINQAYHDDDNDGHLQEDGFVTDHDRVNFGTFFPPPPTEPPPPVPDSDAGDSIASEEESINSDDEPDYINAVLPPHEDFADADHVNSQDIPSSNGDSPTTDSRTDSTSQLISPVSYKDRLLHDTTFGFEPLRRSSNPEQTTEL